MSYFIDICLICLQHSNILECIKFQDANGISFEDKLEDFLPEYGLDLDIPTYICAECGRYLTRIYEFKRKCLRNKTTYKKYAQQITTSDSSNKYLSVVINPDLINVKEEISDENNHNIYILEYQTEINVGTENSDKFIIKEEGNEELVLDDESKLLLREIKKETSDSDDTHNLNNIIEENMQISDNFASSPTDNGNINEQYECYVCHKTFLTKEELNSHILSHSTEQNKSLNNSENISNCAVLEQNIHKICDIQLYECEICNKSFKYPKNLKKHQCNPPNKKPYSCGVCSKSFSQSSELHKHNLKHTGEKPFTCEVCNKSFNWSSNLRIHKLIHTGEKPYTCEVCNKSFNWSSNLKMHKLIHTGERPFTCEVCNKSFNQSSSLKNHKLIHTGEKPLTCDVCSKSFSRLSHLKWHKLQHTDEKPFTCEVCNKSFKQASSLRSHKRVHTGEKPFTCEVCNKSFRRATNLKEHQLVHTDIKSFSCEVCNKSFKQASSLRSHKRLHTGEKPFTCEVCNKSFRRSFQLKAHKLKHTGC